MTIEGAVDRAGDVGRMSPNHLAKRDAIVTAAVQVLLRDGVGGCTVRSIATEAGVSKGAVHYYFEDVDEILDRAMLEAVHGWIAWLRAGVESDGAGASAEDAFWHVMDACLRPFASGDRTLMPLWLEYWASRTRAEQEAPLREIRGVLVSYVAELLEAAGADDPAARASAVTAYLFGTGMQQSVHAVPPEQVHRHVAALSGLRAPVPAAPRRRPPRPGRTRG